MGWARFIFKGNKVFAEVDDQGLLVATEGRVQIRYRVEDSRSYLAAARNLTPVTEAKESAETGSPTETSPDAKPKARKKAAQKGGKSKKTPLHMVTSEDEELRLLASSPAGVAPIIIYTDGACRGNPGPAGLGVVLQSDSHRRELSEFLGRGTNNIAELMAVKRALEEVKSRDRRVLLHLDSEYVRGVLTLGWKAKANQELIKEIRRLASTFTDLHLIKVLAHSGVEENERADRLANLAIDRAIGKNSGSSKASS